MKQEVFALIDCNNFYASCERVFNPALRSKPVMILSNNDGCVIARSQEVKALGIPMGAPLFTCKHLIHKHNIQVFSSNFTLYGDMSMRVMRTLCTMVPDVEIYSIDEAFVRLTNLAINNPEVYAREIKRRIYRWTGIPVSIGIGPTKTLAKLANHFAKNQAWHNGVFDIGTTPDMQQLLDSVPVEKVWGIGFRSAKLLNKQGIRTAWQFTQLPDVWIRKQMTISGLRTAWELRGTPCNTFGDNHAQQKSMAYTRSFGTALSTKHEVVRIGAAYGARLAHNLREQRLQASALYIFLMTSRHIDKRAFFSITVPLTRPTSYTPTLIDVITKTLDKLFRSGYNYKKIGIIALDLLSAEQQQADLFISHFEVQQQRILMQQVDTINEKWGRDTVLFAAQGTSPIWRMRQELKTPEYTTKWDQIPYINIC